MTVQIAGRVDLRKYVEKRLFEDRPHIRERRIPVAMIVGFARHEGWTVAETAYNFTLSEAEVLAAMLYYEEHQAEIEQQETEEAVKFEEMKRLYDSD